MAKKVSYMKLLQEAVSEHLNEYDARAMDYRGPMTDSPLTFTGDGEIETHKDASSILERYYFNENKEKLIEQDEEVGPDNALDVDEDDDAEDPNEIVTGEEPDDVEDTMEDLEDEILGEDYEPGDEDIVAKDEPLDDEDSAPVNNEIAALENTVIERLIQEMEEEADGGEAGTDLADEKEVDEILEDLELEEDEDEPESDDEEDDELDVDKEVANEGEGMGPIRIKAARELEEAFRIFKEQIEDEEEVEDDEKDEEEVEEDFSLFEDEDLEDEIDVEEDKEDKEKDEEEVEEDFSLF